MKKGTTLFLRIIVSLIGLGVLALCLFVLPLGIISDQTGLYRPIFIGMYVTAIPFFFALYQSWLLLAYIDKNTAFSSFSVKALGNIKYSGLAISAFYTLEMPYIFHVGDKDDAPGAILIALVIIFASLVIAVFAGLLQKLLQSAIKMKEENELTV
jgi:hypothetical protein